jgi:ferric-dicitrate binding protein FerR (iron transport regulator)
MDQSQNQFWSLLSKKLSQDELHLILLNNPELQHQADMLTEMWKQPLKNRDIVINESTYVRHIMKHKDDFFADVLHEEAGSTEIIIEEKRGFFNKRRVILFSIPVLLILGTAAFYFFSQNKVSGPVAGKSISSVATKNGNRTKIVLPDGSQVWLNAGSTLDYNNADFNKEIREVSLNGEAYFDVTKNAEKPFIIHTKKMDIKVIGTAFNVRSYNDDKIAEASLIRGTIEVTLKDRKDQKILLKPNEKISVVNEEPKQETKPEKVNLVKSTPVLIPQIVVKEIKPNPTYNIIGEIAWTQNKLYFEDETFEDIGHRMERWYGKKVTIANESLKSVHYTGNFENETMEEVLSYLKLSRSFNFRIGSDNVVIY